MKRGKPAFIVKQGSAQVVVYKSAKRNQFCLSYRKHAGAARSRETRTGEKAARARALDIAIALANGRAEVIELSAADRDSYLAAKSLLPAGVLLHEAVETFLHGRSKRSPSVTVTEIATQFLRSKETSLRIGDLSDVHVKNLRDDIGKFVDAFPGPIGNIRSDELQDWLNSRCDKKGEPVGPRRRRNIRARVVSIFNYARNSEYLPLNVRTAAEKTACPKIIKNKEPTFEPEQFDVLINAAHRDSHKCELVPVFAIGAFGRMRMSEIGRLDWLAINIGAAEIDVSPRVAGKTGMARIIEMPPNLVKWLEPYIRSSGPVLNPTITRIDNHVRRFAQKLGLKWQRNILRGSCASYLYALTNDLKYVATQLGTSERELKREYLERKTKDQAEKWHAIVPAEKGNVLELRWSVRE